MSRRKGERPVVRTVRAYDEAHPVARAIATGSKWFHAWIAQETTPYFRLTKITGIPIERISAIDHGAAVTADELQKLAAAWFVTPADLARSMPPAARPENFR